MKLSEKCSKLYFEAIYNKIDHAESMRINDMYTLYNCKNIIVKTKIRIVQSGPKLTKVLQ